MAYYVDKIEQVVGTEEAPVNEYGSRTKKGSYDAALTSFYTDLMNVSNDIHTEETPTKKHYFMDIRIVDSKGGVVKKDAVGTHQE
jgi:hypothetical protein